MRYQFTFILCLIPFLVLSAQTTYVPDDNFEQALIDLGLDDVLDDYILTSNISGVTSLDLQSQNISDLTGLQDFVSLRYFDASNNQFPHIPFHPNANLYALTASNNQLTQLDLSQHTNLTELACANNLIVNLDLSQNSNLKYLTAGQNSFPELDISNHPNLREVRLFGQNNSLLNVDIRNGNNTMIQEFVVINNPNLPYIYVDDCDYSTINWTDIDPTTIFVEMEGQTECEMIGVEDNFLIQNIAVYPNPVWDFITIETANGLNIEEIAIFSISGKRIRNLYNDFEKIDFKSFPAGVYYLEIQSNKGSTVKKVLKN
ncbi:T9SS type A sorting domain-containing protein [Aequorivita marina]|uniref:T9SS type A sorting domain-containing protein n=1 Tax=Aequorivita marina TaxID=3073654 RepID=UPI002875B5D6|nr:T9SS type A sorting domain-containing protein [Aequorivita sp. S2608]MDS1298975.1 T9SS type A sorting domain-containing protein [Aequorivita sp. S2608]